MNRSVEQVLRTSLDNSPLEKWEEKLPLVEMAINNSTYYPTYSIVNTHLFTLIMDSIHA